MALLSEVYYNRPLVERYGDRYFEYMLRNRYEEDLPLTNYVYRIDKSTREWAEKDKFITKLRSNC